MHIHHTYTHTRHHTHHKYTHTHTHTNDDKNHSVPLQHYLEAWSVQPMTVLQGTVKMTSLEAASTSTIVSAAMASMHSTCTALPMSSTWYILKHFILKHYGACVCFSSQNELAWGSLTKLSGHIPFLLLRLHYIYSTLVTKQIHRNRNSSITNQDLRHLNMTNGGCARDLSYYTHFVLTKSTQIFIKDSEMLCCLF